MASFTEIKFTNPYAGLEPVTYDYCLTHWVNCTSLVAGASVSQLPDSDIAQIADKVSRTTKEYPDLLFPVSSEELTYAMYHGYAAVMLDTSHAFDESSLLAFARVRPPYTREDMDAIRLETSLLSNRDLLQSMRRYQGFEVGTLVGHSILAGRDTPRHAIRRGLGSRVLREAVNTVAYTYPDASVIGVSNSPIGKKIAEIYAEAGGVLVKGETYGVTHTGVKKPMVIYEMNQSSRLFRLSRRAA